jgi:hypothetical protein
MFMWMLHDIIEKINKMLKDNSKLSNCLCKCCMLFQKMCWWYSWNVYVNVTWYSREKKEDTMKDISMSLFMWMLHDTLEKRIKILKDNSKLSNCLCKCYMIFQEMC